MFDNHLKWFQKADEDLTSADILLKENGVPGTICFLSQQAAEKYLKGFLVFHEKNFTKVHDLLELETLLLDIVPDIRELHENLVILNGYYIGARYPGDYPEFSVKEADDAFKKASQVKNFVLRKTH